MFWALLCGCTEFGIDPVDPALPPQMVAIEEEFVQQPLPAVDLLFVIDDTASMAQEQVALAEGLSALVTSLNAQELSWQAGVVTMDHSGEDAGWLLGSPYVLSSSLSDAEALFALAVQVGTDGQAVEAGLAAATTALELAAPGGPNAGFRRDEASLHVVFLSDSDDGSQDWLGDDPVGAFIGTLEDQAVAGESMARASAIVGDVPGGCLTKDGSAQAGFAYASVVEASGGVLASICQADFGDLLDAVGTASLSWTTEFTLREVPIADSVRVSVDGERLDTGWAVQGATVLFDAPPAPAARVVISYLVEGP